MVRNQRLLPFVISPLLCVLASCHYRQEVLLNYQANGGPPPLYAEKGGIIEFRVDHESTEQGHYKGPYQITFVDSNPCDKKDKLVATDNAPAVCHVVKNGVGPYTFKIEDSTQSEIHRGVIMNIRRCPSCPATQ
jgi:hypothetical protein